MAEQGNLAEAIKELEEVLRTVDPGKLLALGQYYLQRTGPWTP
jgi:hypothetical protein